MYRLIVRCSFIIVYLLVLSGCSRVFIVPEKEYTKEKADKDIPVLKIGEDIDFKYNLNSHILVHLGAFVSAHSPLNSADEIPPDVIKKMKKVANKLGADAVIGLTNSSYFGVIVASHYASGLAVNYEGENIEEPKEGIVTCLLPLSSQKNGEKAVAYDTEVRQLARHFLTMKGYYVLTPVADYKVDETSIEKIVGNYDMEQVCGIKPDIIIKFFPKVDESGSVKLAADVYSLKNGSYIMVSSKAVDKRNPALATALMGIGGLIATTVGSDEASMSSLLKPLPNIR